MVNDGVGILFQNNEQFLLLHRNNEDIWECPKGHIEERENHKEAIVRELFEETGIEIFDILSKIGVLTFEFISKKTGKQKRRDITYYHVKTNILDVKISSEHNDFKWLNKEDLMSTLQFDDIKDLFKKYFNKNE
jgi:8-oxo-dGTP pyrophosphatase MutT (NUDIX family)